MVQAITNSKLVLTVCLCGGKGGTRTLDPGIMSAVL